MKGPSRYSPVADTDRAARRATIVLDEMVRIHAITAAAARRRPSPQPVRVNPVLANQRAQYFTDWVDDQVRHLVGEPTEDLVVETTLDLPLQASAEQAVQAGVAAAQTQGVQQAALVSLDGEGRVRAYVGGVNYLQSQFDRATQARRQAGSSFKPFVYLTAMEAGRTPDTPVVDEPITIGNWTPRNYTGQLPGPDHPGDRARRNRSTPWPRGWPTRSAPSNVAATAHRLGIASPIQLDPSMALGAVEVSPLEMAQAYAPFSNGGVFAKGYGIERIRTAVGPGALRPRRRQRPAPRGDRPAGALLHDPHDAPGDRLRHRHAGRRSRAMTWPARPAPPATTATPGSSATPAASSPPSGSAATTTRPMKKVTGGGPPAGHLARLHDPGPARLAVQPIPGAMPRRRPTAHRRHRRDHQRRPGPAARRPRAEPAAASSRRRAAPDEAPH